MKLNNFITNSDNKIIGYNTYNSIEELNTIKKALEFYMNVFKNKSSISDAESNIVNLGNTMIKELKNI